MVPLVLVDLLLRKLQLLLQEYLLPLPQVLLLNAHRGVAVLQLCELPLVLLLHALHQLPSLVLLVLELHVQLPHLRLRQRVLLHQQPRLLLQLLDPLLLLLALSTSEHHLLLL